MDLNAPHQGYEEVGAPTETTFTNFEEFEAYKKTVLSVVEQAKCCMRLMENKDFQTVIMEAYLRDEPRRLGELMGSGRLTPKAFEESAEDLRGIGNLFQFLSQYAQKGVLAQEELEGLEEARKAALEQGA